MTAEIGEPAPGFELVDQTRSLVSLGSLLGLTDVLDVEGMFETSSLRQS